MNGSHWCFLCFTPDRLQLVHRMLSEISVANNRDTNAVAANFPPGVLWNKEACTAVFVPKGELDARTLRQGLRKHFGYECPEPHSDVFTLGVKPEDDALLDQVGLFGNKK
jgi:hypothetical protein